MGFETAMSICDLDLTGGESGELLRDYVGDIPPPVVRVIPAAQNSRVRPGRRNSRESFLVWCLIWVRARPIPRVRSGFSSWIGGEYPVCFAARSRATKRSSPTRRPVPGLMSQRTRKVLMSSTATSPRGR